MQEQHADTPFTLNPIGQCKCISGLARVVIEGSGDSDPDDLETKGVDVVRVVGLSCGSGATNADIQFVH
jgi:hypothetical protein